MIRKTTMPFQIKEEAGSIVPSKVADALRDLLELAKL